MEISYLLIQDNISFLFIFWISINCPHYCQCLVSNHLRHVGCIGKGLISVDLNVPHSVQWLQLTNNLIYELEDKIFEILGLRHIMELHLDKNAIQSIGLNAFSGLTKLRSIDLSDNRLRYIPSGVFQPTPSLINVFLNRNPLAYIRKNEPFLNSSSIQTLDISNCRISYIPELALSSLYLLVKLNISSNHIENIDYFSYKDLKYLKEIDISNNMISCDDKSEEFLSWAYASSIKVFGSFCVMNTTPLPKVVMMEKMVMYQSENGENETEDLSVNFDNECSCFTSDSKYEEVLVNTEAGIKINNINEYLGLFLVIAFMCGFVVGISVTISFWICYRLFISRRKTHLCYTSIRINDPLPSYDELYNNEIEIK